MDTWNSGLPKESGYYLAKWGMWGDARKKRVSEFWFDGRNWYTKREYVDGDCYSDEFPMGICVTDLVLFYMEKPK